MKTTGKQVISQTVFTLGQLPSHAHPSLYNKGLQRCINVIPRPYGLQTLEDTSYCYMLNAPKMLMKLDMDGSCNDMLIIHGQRDHLYSFGNYPTSNKLQDISVSEFGVINMLINTQANDDYISRVIEIGLTEQDLTTGIIQGGDDIYRLDNEKVHKYRPYFNIKGITITHIEKFIEKDIKPEHIYDVMRVCNQPIKELLSNIYELGSKNTNLYKELFAHRIDINDFKKYYQKGIEDCDIYLDCKEYNIKAEQVAEHARKLIKEAAQSRERSSSSLDSRERTSFADKQTSKTISQGIKEANSDSDRPMTDKEGSDRKLAPVRPRLMKLSKHHLELLRKLNKFNIHIREFKDIVSRNIDIDALLETKDPRRVLSLTGKSFEDIAPYLGYDDKEIIRITSDKGSKPKTDTK